MYNISKVLSPHLCTPLFNSCHWVSVPVLSFCCDLQAIFLWFQKNFFGIVFQLGDVITRSTCSDCGSNSSYLIETCFSVGHSLSCLILLNMALSVYQMARICQQCVCACVLVHSWQEYGVSPCGSDCSVLSCFSLVLTRQIRSGYNSRCVRKCVSVSHTVGGLRLWGLSVQVCEYLSFLLY